MVPAVDNRAQAGSRATRPSYAPMPVATAERMTGNPPADVNCLGTYPHVENPLWTGLTYFGDCRAEDPCYSPSWHSCSGWRMSEHGVDGGSPGRATVRKEGR